MSVNRGNNKLGISYNRSRTRSKAASKKEQNKILNYFSPKKALVDNTNADLTYLSNGLHPDALDVVSASEFSNTLTLSSPTKKESKLQNGLPHMELPVHSVCTRSQSQKYISNLTEEPKSLEKEPKIISTDVKGSSESIVSCTLSSNSAKELKTPPSSPTSKESSSMDGCISTSPHTGPSTPHKIQALNEAKLRLDSPLSPSAITKLKIISPRKIKFSNQASNAKRKLPISNSIPVSNDPSENVNPADKPANPVVNGALKSNQKPTMKNTQMTQFFPIRRSHRKPKAALLQEKQKEIEEKILSGKEEGLEVECFGAKGRGVKTTRLFKKGEMVVEYAGDLVDMKEAKDREKKYSLDTSKGCYMYYFTYQNTQYCIDATEESSYLGRLVNHSRNGNLVTKAVMVQGKLHLILMAKKDLEAGTEILYDYGDRSKQSLEHHPWLAF